MISPKYKNCAGAEEWDDLIEKEEVLVDQFLDQFFLIDPIDRIPEVKETKSNGWVEIGEDDYWGDTLPDWYMNLMTGSGTLDALFGGASDE